ncbi:hypothetical protein MRX96_041057 [Rhipicephalus microplus]
MQHDQADTPAKVPVVEETIVPKEAQLLYTAEVDVEALRQELDAARRDVQSARESAHCKEQDIQRLTEDLDSVKNKLEEAQRQLRVKHEEARHVGSATEEPTSEAHEDESRQALDTELKKLKLAFKKSRGELRLKVKILEDRTKEVQSLKEQNSCLQKELEQLTEALANERTNLKTLAEELKQRDMERVQFSSELRSLKEHLDLEIEKNESLSKELQEANAEVYNLRVEVGELRLQSPAAGSREREVEELKKQLDFASEALKALSAENEVLKANISQDTEHLRSELQSSKAELERLSVEHEDALNVSLSRERVLQNELDAATELIQQLHSEHADFSRKKSEEFGLLQGQLESLSGDLTKQLEIVDSKVEEADALQSKLQTSQLQLEKFSAEYSILQDVLLQEYIADSDRLEEELKIAEDSKDLQALLRAVSEHVRSLKNANSTLLKETENLKLSYEEINARLQVSATENEHWQLRYQELLEVFEKKGLAGDNVTDITRE